LICQFQVNLLSLTLSESMALLSFDRSLKDKLPSFHHFSL